MAEPTANRLYFIDAIRAFAICMMMQGHFVSTLLDTNKTDTTHLAYQIWEYFRGITAPVFFTVSGLVFTYLLLRANRKGSVRKRLKKGISRGLLLIVIGYGLRAPVFSWLNGEFPASFLVIDVLHCIGLSLIITVLLFMVSFKNSNVFAVLLIVIATILFMLEPFYARENMLVLENWPNFLVNWVSKINRSVFTIIPWYGYMAYGAVIATLFDKYVQFKYFKISSIILFITVGIFLAFYSEMVFLWLGRNFDSEILKAVGGFNYLYARLGNVFIIIGLFFMFERFLKGSLIAKIGQKTLSIYVIHFAIIYGCFTGLGLNNIIGSKTLNPLQATVGAIIFVIVTCIIALNYVKTNAFIYSLLRKFMRKLPFSFTNIKE